MSFREPLDASRGALRGRYRMGGAWDLRLVLIPGALTREPVAEAGQFC